MMNCSDIEELLPRFAAGELNSEERTTVEKHIFECGSCSKSLMYYYALEKSLSSLGETLPSHREIADSVINEVMAKKPAFDLKRAFGVPALAFMGAVLLITTLFLKHHSVLRFSLNSLNAFSHQVSRLFGFITAISASLPFNGFWLALSLSSLFSLIILGLGGFYVLSNSRN